MSGEVSGSFDLDEGGAWMLSGINFISPLGEVAKHGLKWDCVGHRFVKRCFINLNHLIK